MLDCDLVDFLMEEHELSLQQRNDQLDAKKHEMYTADVQTLIDLKNRFLKYLEDLIIDIGCISQSFILIIFSILYLVCLCINYINMCINIFVAS